MIRQLRKSIQGTLGRFLIILFCIPFALFGAEALLTVVETDSTIGEVNGEPLNRFELSRLIDRLNAQFGEAEQTEEIANLVRESALDSLVQQELLVQAGRSTGLEVPPTVLDDVVRSMPEFQQAGRYSPLMFANLARDLGLTQDQLRASLERQLLLSRLAQALSHPDESGGLDELLRLWTHRRDLDYLTLEEKDFIPPQLDEPELREHYDAHPERFMTREEVDVSVVELSDRELNKRAAATVTEQSVADAYQAYRQSEAAQARRRAAHIMLTWEDEDGRAGALQQAQQIHAELVGGADFAELAQRHSQDPSAGDGGDLGFTRGDVFPEPFETALAVLEVGGISEPVEIEGAVHIIRLVELGEVEIRSFDEMAADLRRQLTDSERQRLEPELLERLGELAYSLTSVEDLAAEMQLEVQQLDAIYSGRRDGPLTGLPGLQQAALAPELTAGDLISEPIRTPDNGILVLQVRNHRPSRPLEFAEAHERVATDLGRQRARAALDQKADTLRSALQSGATLQDAAQTADIQVPVKNLQNIDRSTPLLDRQVVEALFELPADSPGQWRRVQTSSGVTWIQLLAARPADTTVMPEAQARNFLRQIATLRTSIARTMLLDHLRQNADVWLKPPEDQTVPPQSL